jgi:hypothetical protein
VRMQKSGMKTMLTAFPLCYEFVTDRHTENGKFYKEVIKRLIVRVRRVRPEGNEGSPCHPLYHTNMI